MKLRCKKDYSDASSGVFGIGAHPAEKINGLTKGKEYTGQFVAIVDNWTQSTTIESSDYRFLTYNDLGEWEVYESNLFEPA